MIPKSGYRFFGKDHAPPKSWSGMTIRRKVIPLQAKPGENKSYRTCDSLAPPMLPVSLIGYSQRSGAKMRMRSNHEVLVVEAEHHAAPARPDMLVLIGDVLPARRQIGEYAAERQVVG